MRRSLASRATVSFLLLGASLALFTACAPADRYEATIRRTSHGIPHISAADLGSLAFGEGYAHAEDHFCSLMDQVIRARGERARFFGRGEDDEHLDSDLALRALAVHERAAEEHRTGPETARDWIEGYVAGVNLWLEETGSQSVPGWCAGEPWVGPITAADVSAYRRLVGLMAGFFTDMIATAQPPGMEAETPSAAAATATAGRWLDRSAAMASNGWAIGSERSAGGGGMLIANPHYPWEGSNRFWEKHLTIPGDFDAYGVSLLGLPGVSIGFNENIAWTHTVSAGQRFTLYTLDLVEGDPTSYLYDGEPRSMTAREVEVEVLEDDGTLSKVKRTLYFSHYGPIVDWPELGWTEERAITYRDANDDNDETVLTYLAMSRAAGMDELQQAHAEGQGILFVNTIATSRDGRAWYADVSAAPNLSDEAISAWRARLDEDAITAALYRRGLILLDGSDSTYEWIDDSRARDPGVVPYAEVPKLERRDYVFNANDSYWLSHHEERLEGFAPVHGPERTPRSLRTRMNLTTLSDTSADGPAGEDGKFTLDELAAAALSNRTYTALLLRDGLVDRCRATGTVRLDGERVTLSEACDVLAAWNGRLDLDSRGAVLFREWITRYEDEDLRQAGALFETGFDAEDPLHTPRGLAPGPMAVENLARAAKVLERAGFALDVSLGELQHSNKRGGRIPIHGGLGGYEGVENVVFYRENTTTLEPAPEVAALVEGSRVLRTDGYPITYGTSFIMALEFRDDGPHAQAFLTYSESGDRDSPHFVDQTELFSEKAWRPILYGEADIAADPQLVEKTVSAEKGP